MIILNKNVIGKIKDEYGGKIIAEFVGLKSTMYAILTVDGKKSTTTKGVNVALVFPEFKDILFDKKVVRHKMRRMEAKLHEIGTYEVEKTPLSCFDDERFILNDGINTLAYGHKDIPDLRKNQQQ